MSPARISSIFHLWRGAAVSSQRVPGRTSYPSCAPGLFRLSEHRPDQYDEISTFTCPWMLKRVSSVVVIDPLNPTPDATGMFKFFRISIRWRPIRFGSIE